MPKNYLKMPNDIETALCKVVLMSFFLFFSSTTFGKNHNEIDTKSDEKAVIFISDGTKLYSDSKAVIYNAEIIKENQTKNEIFVSGGAMVYSNDAASNIKIVKLQNPEKNNKKKATIFPNKNETVNKIVAVEKKSVSEQYLIIPFHSSSLFSKCSNGILLFLSPASQISLSAIHTLSFDFQSAKIQISNSKIIYKNPFVEIEYFTGQYFARPPTLFS